MERSLSCLQFLLLEPLPPAPHTPSAGPLLASLTSSLSVDPPPQWCVHIQAHSPPALLCRSPATGVGPRCAARQPPSLHGAGRGVGREGTQGDRGRASVGRLWREQSTAHTRALSGPAGLKDPARVTAWGACTPWLSWIKLWGRQCWAPNLQAGQFTLCLAVPPGDSRGGSRVAPCSGLLACGVCRS